MKQDMIVFSKEDRQVSLNEFVRELNVKVSEYYQRTSPILCEGGPYVTIIAEPGRKYVKLVSVGRSQRSVYCFLDMNGNIFKAATWKAPAKHIRGSIFDENYGWGKALGPYGAAYLK